MRKKVLPMGKRIHYLDNLAGIFFAALGNFRPFPLLHPYVPAPMHSIEGLAVDFLYNLAIVFIVPAIFFISAYFGASSLRIHMIRPYFKNKWTRLGWPWLIGTVLLAPELLYLASRSCGSHGDGPAFSLIHPPFWSAYFQSPFFFIGLLLLFHWGQRNGGVPSFSGRLLRLPLRESWPFSMYCSSPWRRPSSGCCWQRIARRTSGSPCMCCTLRR